MARTLDDNRFAAAVDDFAALGFTRYPTLNARPAQPHRGTARQRDGHDTAYVALAQALDCELVTGDARLAS